MRRVTTLVLGGAFLAGAAMADDLPGGDRTHGKTLAGQCRTCHGIEGLAKIVIAPNIGGESALYIAKQLMAFRDGTREQEMMSVVAKNLSDQDIADLAAWYSGHKAEATLSADKNAAPEVCVACHGANGIALIEEAPNLAGESTIYIDKQLKDFRSGKRPSGIMGPIASELSDADIRAIADWYAAVKLEITQED